MTTRKKSTAAAAKAGAATRKPGTVVASSEDSPSPAALQIAAFQDGVRLFTARKFAEARAAFEKVPGAPTASIADKARSYVQICERQMARPSVELRTAEDHYNFGVERLNARDIEQARFHLERAASLSPNTEHILYTLALTCGLDGDGDAACENLKRAIQMEPRNRILARQDPDFAALASQNHVLKALLETPPAA